MITYNIKAGTVDVSVVIRIIDSTDGTPETAVVWNTAGIDLEYRREGAVSTDITEATLAALTTAHTDGGFLHIGNGYYRLDLPDAACAAGVKGVLVHGIVTGMVVIGCYVHLVTYDPFDSVRMGMTALPNAAADAAGGLPISDAGGLDVDAILADTNELQGDWVNAGRLDAILDIIAADVVNLDGAAMRGTDSAALASVLGAAVGASISADIAAIKAQTVAIEADTDVIDDGTSGLVKIASDVAAILVDTGTTLDTKINNIQGATFNSATDSLEAIRDRGDAAWITGAGGSDRLLMVDTTIATLASQTSFTLTAGSADNDAYNNCTIVIEDVSTATQKAVGLVSDYIGATKTVTLKYDPAVFTMAPTDKVYILAENALKATLANRQLNVAADGDIAGNVDGSVASLVGHTVQTGDSYPLVSTEVADIYAAVITNAAGADIAADIIAVKAETAAIVNDTDVIDDATSGLVKIASDVAAVLVDTTVIGALGAGLTALATQASVDAIKAETALIVADTNELQVDDYPASFAALPTAAAIKTAIEAGGSHLALIKAVTDALSAAAATKIALSAGTIVTGAAALGTLSTTQMTTNLIEATNDHYNGRIIIWTSGVLINQATDITDYDGATKMFTFTAVTEAPSNGDTFIIV